VIAPYGQTELQILHPPQEDSDIWEVFTSGSIFLPGIRDESIFPVAAPAWTIVSEIFFGP